MTSLKMQKYDVYTPYLFRNDKIHVYSHFINFYTV